MNKIKPVLVVLFLLLLSEVYSQHVNVSATKQNVLYVGVHNPLDIVVYNHSCDEFYATTNNGGLIKIDSCLFAVIPNTVGKTIISVFGLDSVLINEIWFRTKSIPKGELEVVNGINCSNDSIVVTEANHRYEKCDGVHTEYLLGIVADLYNLDFDFKLEVMSFTVKIYRDEILVDSILVESNKFPEKVNKYYYNLVLTDYILLENIMVYHPGGNIRNYGELIIRKED